MARRGNRPPVRKIEPPEVPSVATAAPRPAAEASPEEQAAEAAVQRMVEAAYT